MPDSKEKLNLPEGVAPRDFRKFLAENSNKIQFSSDKENALQVGDYLEIPFFRYMRWMNLNKDLEEKYKTQVVTETRKSQIFTTIEGVDYDEISQVYITEIIKKNGKFDSIKVKCNGIEKIVHPSLFYNFFQTKKQMELSSPDRMFDGGQLVGAGDIVNHDGSTTKPSDITR